MSDRTETIRAVLKSHARLSKEVEVLALDDDLYQAGMTSHASVNVMLAVEDAFDIEFPDEMLKPSVFRSLQSISDAVDQLEQAA